MLVECVFANDEREYADALNDRIWKGNRLAQPARRATARYGDGLEPDGRSEYELIRLSPTESTLWPML